MMFAFLVPILFACVFAPVCYVTAALPAVWIFQTSVLGDPSVLVKAGPVDLTLVDVVLLVLMARFAISVVATRQLAAELPLYGAFAAFLLVHFLATAAAGSRFGGTHMMQSFTAFARLLSEIAIVPILAQAITRHDQARRCLWIVVATLTVLALIQFINFFGASHGIVIGEVQGLERGEERYFGPVGDSIGVVLLLGFIGALCFANLPAVLLFGGGIMLTAGLGATFCMGVATVLFLFLGTRAGAVRSFARKYLWVAPILVFGGIAFLATAGRPMVTTLTDRLLTGRFKTSADQRMLSSQFGVKMFLDRPLTGVGYMGYLHALDDYGGAKFFDLNKEDGGTANANNQLIQTLTDGGVPGLLSTALLLFAAARIFLRAEAATADLFMRTIFRAAFIYLLAQILGNLAAVWLVPSSYVARFLWVLLGIAVAVWRISPPKKSSDAPIARSQSPDFVAA